MSAVAEPQAPPDAPSEPPEDRPAARPPGRPVRARWAFPLAAAGVLLGALLLRLWGVEHGLPYAYNADENAHFLPRAIGMFGHGLDPEYFVNPPAYTYVLHWVLGVWFGGREGVADAFAADPTEVWVVGRVVAALLGTIAVGLVVLVGARLFDRRAGLLAAALMGVAFLPVFYAHLALNDVPTLAPVCLALLGAVGIAERGRRRDFVLAGAGLGLACATKYTGGVVLLPVLAAALLRGVGPRRMLLAGGAALVAFLLANPYALLDPAAVWDGITHQSTAADDRQGKLGLTAPNGWAYYAWAFTWGLGWIPLVAAVAAGPLLWRHDRRAFWLLVPAPLLFVAFMGTQERFFGRWLLPIFPFVCLLAAFTALLVAERLALRRTQLRPALLALAVVALCGQGLMAALHLGGVLSREDTRNVARAWLVENVPPATKVVVEPIAPDLWAQDIGSPSRLTANGNRWVKFPTSRSRIDPDDPEGPLLPPPGAVVNVEDFERVLEPGLVDRYEAGGYCWVVVGSTQRGRAEAEPEDARRALAYYAELERRSFVALRVSPYGRGEGPVGFNFDWSFDFYPRAYHRPGPEVTVHRLTGGRCGGPGS